MTKKGTIQECLVCGDTSCTIRFGAISCRACGEFFRRNVVSKNQNFKKCSENCMINKRKRKTCKKCRFEKCIEIGMLESQVSSRTRLAGEESQSILKGLQGAYRRLEVARVERFGPIEKNPNPEYCNHIELDEVFSKDIDLICRNFMPTLKRKVAIDKQQEEILTDHFIIRFNLLETSYRSRGTPSYTLPNGKVFDNLHLDILYQGVGGPDDSEEIFKPYWNSTTRIIKEPIDRLNLDCSEMLLLSALIYWDFGIQNQTDYCISKCQAIRTKVYQELIIYLKQKTGNDDVSIRVMELMSVLVSLEKASNTIINCGHVAKIFDLKGKKCPLYQALNN